MKKGQEMSEETKQKLRAGRVNMMPKQDAFQKVRIEEADRIWNQEKNREILDANIKVQIKLDAERKAEEDVFRTADGLCQCCFLIADKKTGHGQIHHRNGNIGDYNSANLIWLCRKCYNQVNEITGPTITSLQAELP